MTEKCTHVLAQIAAKSHRYLLNQNKTDQYTVTSVSQNTKNQDFRKDTKSDQSFN